MVILLTNPLSLILARILVAFVLLTSAYGKLSRPCHFISVIQTYQLLPKSLVRPFASALPWSEVIIGLLLVLGWQTYHAAVTGASLMTIFILAIAINLARGRTELECGCFGARHWEKIGWKVMARDVILLLVFLQLASFGGGFLAFDNLPAATQQLIFGTYIIGVLLPLSLAVAGLCQLTRLLRQLARLVSLIPMEQRQ